MRTRWLIGRVLLAVPTLFAASIVVFLMMHLTPGDPAEAMLGAMAGPAALADLRSQLGLNDPLYVQYGRWLGHATRGDFGESIRQRLPVAGLVVEKFKNTFILGITAFLFAVTAGLLLGFVAGLHRGSWIDRVVILFSSSGIAIPSFFLSLLLSYLVGVRLHLLPSNGMYALEGGGGLVDLGRHLILPAFALSVAPIAVVARMTRSSTLEVIGRDYVRTARAKGLSERAVATRHMLKNALIPIVHLFGLQAGILLSATALVEVVFSWPGIGWLMVDSVVARDLPVTQGCVLTIAVVYALVSVLADFAHMILDPKLQTS